MKINHDKIRSKLVALEKYSNVKINNKIIGAMMRSLERYPGVLPIHIFSYLPGLPTEARSRGYVAYVNNLKSIGLWEELYNELYEEKLVEHKAPYTQLDNIIAGWVDKLQNHPELLSDAEREWVKNNPEYKEIVIK